jgi:hypothetical protein
LREKSSLNLPAPNLPKKRCQKYKQTVSSRR